MLYLSIMITGLATMVPPGALPDNHNQPYKGGAPVVRTFERAPVDAYRSRSWHCFTDELDNAWQAYRSSGSTGAAWDEYKRALARARRNYIYRDPYYVPIVNPAGYRDHGYTDAVAAPMVVPAPAPAAVPAPAPAHPAAPAPAPAPADVPLEQSPSALDAEEIH